MGLAFTMYANEHDDYLPYGRTFDWEDPPSPPGGAEPEYYEDLIRTYLSGANVGMGTNSPVFMCPAAKVSWVLNTNPRNDYRYNYWFATGWSQGQAGRKMTGVKKPSVAVLLYDMAWDNWPVADLPHEGIDAVYVDGRAAYINAAWFISNGNDQSGLFCSDGW
jgi:hypothetical protein